MTREKPRREKPRPTRFGRIGKFCFARGAPEELRGYVNASTYPDGRICEVFITVDRAGTSRVASEALAEAVSARLSFARGMLDASAIDASMRLQRGETIEQVADKHLRTRFEPQGATGNKLIPRATSVLDFVYRWLLLWYSKEKKDPFAGVEPEPEIGRPE